MSVAPEKKIPDDEIDLRSIRKRLSALISYPFFLLFSNVFTTLIFIVLAVLLAVSLKYFIPKSYTSSFILRPLDRNERTHLKILRDIQTLIKYHDYTALASALQLDSNQVKSLQALQTINPSLKNPADSVNTTEVVITSSEPGLFIPFQNALLNYLETSPYFSKIKELQTKQIDLEMIQVEKDLKNLDTLKALQIESYQKQVANAQSVIAINELINPTATYTLAMERVYKKSNLMARRAFLDNFQLVKSCLEIKTSTWPPRILVFCTYLIPAFLVLCFIFLHFRTERALRKRTTA